jgi:hypothetical protein
MQESVRWRPLDERKKNSARTELVPFHQDLFDLYGENWAFHSEYARIINEVARGLHCAAEAIRLSKRVA